jgi:hypothetical protein
MQVKRPLSQLPKLRSTECGRRVHVSLVGIVLRLLADRQSDDVAAIRCRDRLKLPGRAVADGLDALLESPGVRITIARPGSLEILRQL